MKLFNFQPYTNDQYWYVHKVDGGNIMLRFWKEKHCLDLVARGVKIIFIIFYFTLTNRFYYKCLNCFFTLHVQCYFYNFYIILKDNCKKYVFLHLILSYGFCFVLNQQICSASIEIISIIFLLKHRYELYYCTFQ